MKPEDNIKRLKTQPIISISLGYILASQFYSDMKSDVESIYKKIFKEDLRKESNNDRQ